RPDDHRHRLPRTERPLERSRVRHVRRSLHQGPCREPGGQVQRPGREIARRHPLLQGLYTHLYTPAVSDKILVWIGASFEDLRDFPPEARRIAGYELRRIQRGLTPTDWKPMSSVGLGVNEIRIHTRVEHRVIYVAKFEEAIYVLHAFEK